MFQGSTQLLLVNNNKVASIFKSYPNDINGNPRVVNGKIAIGALAAK